jgi:hypothetical protein
MFALLMTDAALLTFSIPLREADFAENAVAIEDEPARIFEAHMALVAMYLKLFVHCILICRL